MSGSTDSLGIDEWVKKTHGGLMSGSTDSCGNDEWINRLMWE